LATIQIWGDGNMQMKQCWRKYFVDP